MLIVDIFYRKATFEAAKKRGGVEEVYVGSEAACLVAAADTAIE